MFIINNNNNGYTHYVKVVSSYLQEPAAFEKLITSEL